MSSLSREGGGGCAGALADEGGVAACKEAVASASGDERHRWTPRDAIALGLDRLVAKAAAQGYGVLLSDGWYLDRQVPVGHSTGWFWLDTWQDMFGVEPLEGIAAKDTKAVIGGEACMWSEQVNGDTFEARTWP